MAQQDTIFKITSGPSRFDLMAARRNKTRIPFTLNLPDTLGGVVCAFMVKKARHDGHERIRWFMRGFYIRPGVPAPVGFKGYYNTSTRTGYVSNEKEHR